MTKLVKSDGNGGLVYQKWLGILMPTLTLISFVWAISATFHYKVFAETLEKRITKLEQWAEAYQKEGDHNRLVDNSRLDRFEGKMEMLGEKIDYLARLRK